ncbi:MAG: type II and III secretion system protein [Endomicrobium sp.]|jgi:pilus assembly protein CpaC|nr:type II and III secretion system protein [Endomicrobium sp.]
MKKLIPVISVLFFISFVYGQKLSTLEKMVEISIEITEINENKSVELGIKWPSEASAGETVIPSIIESGEWARVTKYAATLKALETAGAAEVLSKPKIVTKSSTTARFMVGGEFPIVATEIGTSKIEWKEYGIIMDITPIVLSDSRIDIKLKTELSRLDYNVPVSGYPSIAKREAASHLQLKDGETMVLAGLIETTKGTTKEGIPILSDIPILGALFSVQKNNKTKMNVLIFVTTKILEQ